MTMGTPFGPQGQPLMLFPPVMPAKGTALGGAPQDVPCNATGGAITQSLAFGSKTRGIYISCTTNDVRLAVGKQTTGQLAGQTMWLLPKPFVVCIPCSPGDKLSVISNDATTGTVNVAEIAEAPNPFPTA